VVWVISVYFNLKNFLPTSGTFLPGHPVYASVVQQAYSCIVSVARLDESREIQTSVCGELVEWVVTEKYWSTWSEICLPVPLPVTTNHTLNELGWNPGPDCGLPAELWHLSEHCHSAPLSVYSLHNPFVYVRFILEPSFLYPDPFLPTHCRCRELLFHLITLVRTPLDE
jgi:hypothetical protein